MCKGYKKLDKIEQDDPAIAKEYMERKSIADSRLIFRLRTEMMNLKDNMKNKDMGEDADLVSYFIDVLLMREKKKTQS